MARKVISCMAKGELDSAAVLMRQHRTRRLPVVDGSGALVGLLWIDDLDVRLAISF